MSLIPTEQAGATLVPLLMLALILTVAQISSPVQLKLMVDGTERTALVYSVHHEKPAPVVFVFHGFTGGARQAAFSYRLHEAWPEATVVYPQGLEVELLRKRAPGWQIAPKMQADRDVKFFDAMVQRVKADYNSDPKRIYTCGMSNGAIFSYVLMSTRPETLAAAAPIAGFAAPAFRGAPALPILIVHGKNDPLVPLNAAERSREAAISNNGAGKTEVQWIPGYVQYTPAKGGNDVIWHLHEGGHEWPKGTSEAIVKFFKQHSRA